MKRSTVLLGLVATSVFVGCGSENTPNLNSRPALSAQEPVDKPGSVKGASPKTNQATPKEGQRSDNQVVQDDVRKMARAAYQADVATVLEYTHPNIIELMGGMSRAELALKTAFSKFRSINMKLESFAFPSAPRFLETDVNYFVIVPTKSIVSANGQRFESLNYQFGIQKKGTTTWKYVEGSRINNQNVRTLFPDFPPDHEFPEIYRKKL